MTDTIQVSRAGYEADRRDAELYRWLRMALSDRSSNGRSHYICSIAAGHPEELDEAIRAAMKGNS